MHRPRLGDVSCLTRIIESKRDKKTSTAKILYHCAKNIVKIICNIVVRGSQYFGVLYNAYCTKGEDGTQNAVFAYNAILKILYSH